MNAALKEQAKKHAVQLQQMQEQLNRIENSQNERDPEVNPVTKRIFGSKKLLLEDKKEITAAKEEERRDLGEVLSVIFRRKIT